jgi:hypothetical protein
MEALKCSKIPPADELASKFIFADSSNEDDEDFDTQLNRARGLRKSHAHLFIYDSGATGHMVNDQELLVNVHRLSKAQKFKDVAGKSSSDITGSIPLFGSALFHSDGPVNIISGQQIEHIYPVSWTQLHSYDIHIDRDLIISFQFDEQILLYVSDLSPLVSPFRYQLVTTVHDQALKFSK